MVVWNFTELLLKQLFCVPYQPSVQLKITTWCFYEQVINIVYHISPKINTEAWLQQLHLMKKYTYLLYEYKYMDVLCL